MNWFYNILLEIILFRNETFLAVWILLGVDTFTLSFASPSLLFPLSSPTSLLSCSSSLPLLSSLPPPSLHRSSTFFSSSKMALRAMRRLFPSQSIHSPSPSSALWWWAASHCHWRRVEMSWILLQSTQPSSTVVGMEWC